MKNESGDLAIAVPDFYFVLDMEGSLDLSLLSTEFSGNAFENSNCSGEILESVLHN